MSTDRVPTDEEVVRAIIDRLGHFDFDGVRALLAPGFVQEYPYPPMPGVPERIEGIEPFLEFCRGGMTAFDPYAFRVDSLYETTTPGTIIAEYSSHTRLVASGAPYGNKYVGIFEVDDRGRVSRWREYLNPQVIAATFGR